jgi:hypothetical protein
MKEIKITEDFRVPGTDIILEIGDKIGIKEALRPVGIFAKLEEINSEIRDSTFLGKYLIDEIKELIDSGDIKVLKPFDLSINKKIADYYSETKNIFK